MSIYQRELKSLAFTVHQGLNQYAAIHKKITEEGASFKSAVKNTFGCGISMSALLRDAESLVPVWSAIVSAASEFGRNRYHLLDDDEKKYFDFFIKYIAAINEAITALMVRQRIAADPPVDWRTLQAAAAKYDAAVNRHIFMEGDLNDLRPWK